MIPDSESSKKILKRNVSKKVFHNGKNNCVRLLIFQLNFIDLQKNNQMGTVWSFFLVLLDGLV